MICVDPSADPINVFPTPLLIQAASPRARASASVIGLPVVARPSSFAISVVAVPGTVITFTRSLATNASSPVLFVETAQALRPWFLFVRCEPVHEYVRASVVQFPRPWVRVEVVVVLAFAERPSQLVR